MNKLELLLSHGATKREVPEKYINCDYLYEGRKHIKLLYVVEGQRCICRVVKDNYVSDK